MKKSETATGIPVDAARKRVWRRALLPIVGAAALLLLVGGGSMELYRSPPATLPLSGVRSLKDIGSAMKSSTRSRSLKLTSTAMTSEPLSNGLVSEPLSNGLVSEPLRTPKKRLIGVAVAVVVLVAVIGVVLYFTVFATGKPHPPIAPDSEGTNIIADVTKDSNTGQLPGLFIGIGVAAGLVIIAIAVAVVCCVRRNGKSVNAIQEQDHEQNHEQDHEQDYEQDHGQTDLMEHIHRAIDHMAMLRRNDGGLKNPKFAIGDNHREQAHVEGIYFAIDRYHSYSLPELNVAYFLGENARSIGGADEGQEQPKLVVYLDRTRNRIVPCPRSNLVDIVYDDFLNHRLSDDPFSNIPNNDTFLTSNLHLFQPNTEALECLEDEEINELTRLLDGILNIRA